jgi:retron-type reverse transcriptase
MNCFNHLNVNQFGYRKKTSCKHAYFIANEVVNYYKQGGSKIFFISLDASKAFDKLWRAGLFYKLIGKIESSVWRILYYYYKISTMVVKYGCLGKMFLIKEGVKQGGILSPFLFNLFLDDLISECKKLNLGAKIGPYNLSIIAYCDDIVILSPIENHAQLLINYCDTYSKKWKMEFNTNKYDMN